MAAPGPKAGRVLETSLYVADLERAARFFEETLGFARLMGDERLIALDCGPQSVLLLFKRGTTSETVNLPGGQIPPHEGQGRLHLAFAVDVGTLPEWERRLAERGVAVEGWTNWPKGGRSLYFRDPDANLVELATPGLWGNY
jgi:catechol 2,3-dioxygenase-like lactoylglutathione lyase family enzyme